MENFKGTKGVFKDGYKGWKAFKLPPCHEVGFYTHEIHYSDDGEGIYYDNILIMSKRRPLNEWTDWDYWVKRITDNPNFCPAVFHKGIRCSNEQCKCLKND